VADVSSCAGGLNSGNGVGAVGERRYHLALDQRNNAFTDAFDDVQHKRFPGIFHVTNINKPPKMFADHVHTHVTQRPLSTNLIQNQFNDEFPSNIVLAGL
jgi:hypothetical protein